MSEQHIDACSKSKPKRLDKKAKTVRVEDELAREKNQRVWCEKLSIDWKEKELLYKGILAFCSAVAKL